MTPEDFAAALSATDADPRSRTSRAARRALVDGLTPHAAAVELGLKPSAVYRAVKRISEISILGVCPTCGRSLTSSHGHETNAGNQR